MRRALALVPCAVWLGCGTPPQEVEPRRNHYPRIVDGLSKPEDPVVKLELGSNCKIPGFSAVVEDPDLEDPIRSRWFVDPDVSFSGVSFTAPTLPSSATSVRNTPIVAPQQLFDVGGKLAEAGQHRLVLVIADGEFGVGIETLPLNIVIHDAGVKDPTYTDRFTWFVTTDRNGCPQ